MAQVFQSNVFQNNVFQVAAGAASYTLDTTPGSYTLSGQSVTLLKNSVLIDSIGTYALTGAQPTLTKDNLLTTDIGSYSLSGSGAELTVTTAGAFVLDTTAGSYSITSFPVEMEYTSVQTGGGNSGSVRHLDRIRRDDEQVMRLVIEAFNKLAA